MAWERIKKFVRKNRKPDQYWLTRFVLLRVLGIVYFFAFLSLATQVIPLIGSEGILPADLFLERVQGGASTWDAFVKVPTLFWLHLSDGWLVFFAWLGVILSLVLVFGYANVPSMSVLWFLFMSFEHIGQLWYGYGWEIQLIETGFLAIFLVPLWDMRPFPRSPPPLPVIWLFRWLAFRINLGSGLIKLRSDPCWKDLTCLYYHYEVQPIPNPLSPWFHFLPKFVHRFGVMATHFAQLVVPWFVFWPRIARNVAGAILIGLQLTLIVNGNYSYLNWLTIVPCIAIIDDSWWQWVLPKSLVRMSERAAKRARQPRWQPWVSYTLVVLVLLLSVPVVQNLIGPQQAMNRSFTRVELVNTYGAFGAVGSVRHELIIEGTNDPTAATGWKEYEFFAKPGNLKKPHPIVAPYQPRFAWQIWFAAMSRPEYQGWLIHYLWKLLHNDPAALAFVTENPFPEEPPRFVRVQLYTYEFAPLGSGRTWDRTFVGTWFGPVSKDTQGYHEVIEANWPK